MTLAMIKGVVSTLDERIFGGKVPLMVYSHCTRMEPGQVQEKGTGTRGSY